MFSDKQFLWHPVSGFQEFALDEIPQKVQEGWLQWRNGSGWGVGSLREGLAAYAVARLSGENPAGKTPVEETP